MAPLRSEEPSERGEQGSVGRAEPWTLRGPPKQRDLLAENQELGLASDFAEASANEESEGRTERQVDESEQHRAILTTLRQAGPGPNRDNGTLQVTVDLPFGMFVGVICGTPLFVVVASVLAVVT